MGLLTEIYSTLEEYANKLTFDVTVPYHLRQRVTGALRSRARDIKIVDQSQKGQKSWTFSVLTALSPNEVKTIVKKSFGKDIVPTGHASKWGPMPDVGVEVKNVVRAVESVNESLSQQDIDRMVKIMDLAVVDTHDGDKLTYNKKTNKVTNHLTPDGKGWRLLKASEYIGKLIYNLPESVNEDSNKIIQLSKDLESKPPMFLDAYAEVSKDDPNLLIVKIHDIVTQDDDGEFSESELKKVVKYLKTVVKKVFPKSVFDQVMDDGDDDYTNYAMWGINGPRKEMSDKEFAKSYADWKQAKLKADPDYVDPSVITKDHFFTEARIPGKYFEINGVQYVAATKGNIVYVLKTFKVQEDEAEKAKEMLRKYRFVVFNIDSKDLVGATNDLKNAPNKLAKK